jgi:hypothetical protein
VSVGAFVGGELYPLWMHFFQALLLPYLSFITFLLQGLTKRTLPWLGGQS